MFLEEDDLAHFVRLHWQLLSFVNRQADLFDEFSELYDSEDLRALDIEEQLDLFGVFYEKPCQYIDAYLATNPDRLDADDLEIVESWKALRSGEFVIFRQLQKNAVVLGSGDDDAAYAVLGLTESMGSVIPDSLPALVETALFPFRGKIVYDGLIRSMPFRFTGYGKKMLDKQYKAAKSGPGLLTQLSPLGVRKLKPSSAERVARLVGKLRATLAAIRERRDVLRDFRDNIEPAFQQWLTKTHGVLQRRLETLDQETDRLAALLHRATMYWRQREFRTKAKALDAAEKELTEEYEIFRSTAEEEGDDDDASDAKSGSGTAPFPDSAFDEIPEFLLDSMLGELLRETRGIDPSQLSEKQWRKARQEFRDSFGQASAGDQRALEKSLLRIGADESEKNRAAVTKAFRRLARQVHPDHNDDFGDEAKEIWEQLQQRRDALDLDSLESLEMRWRLIRGDHFTGRDEKRLKQLRQRLADEQFDLDAEIEQTSNHIMWGKKATKTRTPPLTVQKRIKRDFESAIDDLEKDKARLESAIAAFRNAGDKGRAKKQRTKARKKPAARKRKASKGKTAKKKTAASKRPPQPEPPEVPQEAFDFQ